MMKFCKKLRAWSLLLWLLMGCVYGAPTDSQQPLPVDTAFPVTAWSANSQTVIVQWDIQPGYYLYRDRLHFNSVDSGTVRLGSPHFPPSITKSNPILGTYAAYEGQTQIVIPIESASVSSLHLQIKFQGCSENGFCYPPTERVIPIQMGYGLDKIPPQTSLLAANQPVKQLFNHHHHWTMWLGFFGLGILISLTPCVLPMIPILSGLILGKADMSHARAFVISLAYVLGMAITYAIAGILFGLLGDNLQTVLQRPWIIALFSLIFVAMALSLFGFYSLQPPEKLRALMARLSNQQRHGSLIGAAVMGCLSTLILSPCATPALVGVLSYISQAGDTALGGVALFIIGIGMGAPLLLVGAFGRRLLPKAGPWMRVVENILGIVLLGVAIWMLSRILPGWLVMMLWAALAIGLAVYMKTFTAAVTRGERAAKGMGLVVFVYAILLLVGGAQGGADPWRPLRLGAGACHVAVNTLFTPVKTLADVKQWMASAPGKPVLLDFYADWCASCQLMDQRVFANPQVQKQLANWILLRADLTANDMQDIDLMRNYNVIAPPTMLFFDSNHQKMPQSSIVGEVSARDFIERLKVLSAAQ